MDRLPSLKKLGEALSRLHEENKRADEPLPELQDEDYYHSSRDLVTSLVLFTCLYIAAFFFLRRYRRIADDADRDDDEEEPQRAPLPWVLCVLSTAVAWGTTVLIPLTFMVDSASIQGILQFFSIGSAIALYLTMPFSYFYHEAIGDFWGVAGTLGRILETCTVVGLVAVIICGILHLLHSIFQLENADYTMLLGYGVSGIGLLLSLACVPEGCGKLLSYDLETETVGAGIHVHGDRQDRLGDKESGSGRDSFVALNGLAHEMAHEMGRAPGSSVSLKMPRAATLQEPPCSLDCSPGDDACYDCQAQPNGGLPFLRQRGPNRPPRLASLRPLSVSAPPAFSREPTPDTLSPFNDKQATFNEAGAGWRRLRSLMLGGVRLLAKVLACCLWLSLWARVLLHALYSLWRWLLKSGGPHASASASAVDSTMWLGGSEAMAWAASFFSRVHTRVNLLHTIYLITASFVGLHCLCKPQVGNTTVQKLVLNTILVLITSSSIPVATYALGLLPRHAAEACTMLPLLVSHRAASLYSLLFLWCNLAALVQCSRSVLRHVRLSWHHWRWRLSSRRLS